MRKLVLLLLATFAVVSISAQTYHIAGINGWTLTSASEMTHVSGDVYTKTFFGLAAGTYEFKATDGSGWWGFSKFTGDAPVINPNTSDSDPNIRFSIPVVSDITVTFNKASKEITSLTSTNGFSYYVAGITSWAANADLMTKTGSVYTMTFNALPKGTYSFKITNGYFGGSNNPRGKDWGFGVFNGTAPIRDDAGNARFSIPVASNVTISFDGVNITEVTSDNGFSYFVAGNGSSSTFCNGKNWVIDGSELVGGDIASITFSGVAAGKVCEFKITDGAGTAWGFDNYTGESVPGVTAGAGFGSSVLNGNSIKFTTPNADVYPVDIKIVFDCNKKKIVDLIIGRYYVAGNGAPGNSFCDGLSWVEFGSFMRGINPASVVFPRVPGPGEYKFKINPGWMKAWDSPLPTSSLALTCSGGDCDVTFNTSTVSDVIINFNGDTKKIISVLALTSYTLVGDGFIGWNVTNAANDMTWNSTKNVYEKVYNRVQQGSYDYKVAGNYDYNIYQYPLIGNKQMVIPNFSFGAAVTITFDPVANSLSYSFVPDMPTDIDNITNDNVVISVSNGAINCSAQKFTIYNIMGVDVTALNGNLSGIYIVKYNGKTSKVLVK